MRHIQAANFTAVARRSIDLIIIHDMEFKEVKTAAEDVANFFKNQPKGDNGSSAHYCADENSIVSSVWDHDVAWAAPGANHNGLHYELAGYSKQNRKDWGDQYDQDMFEIVAEHAARKAHKYGIRPRKIKAADIKAGRSGFAGHADVTEAYPTLGSHTDPGPHFPWGYFMRRVHHYYGLHHSS